MDFRWLKREHESEAIVIFGGWAVGSQVFDHLTGAYDVLFASDFRDLNAELPDLSAYDRINLVAWSFGVVSYAHWQQGRADPFDHKVAVNGTLTPVDRMTGVPPLAMSKTIETLSQESYQLFLARAFNERQPNVPIDCVARREELCEIEARGDAQGIEFDLVWISDADKIFPTANQKRAWPDGWSRQVSAPHAPFGHFSNWQELLS